MHRRAVRPVLLAVLALLPAAALSAQALPAERREVAGWVAPSEVRLATGRPGPAYWQQEANYRIDAALDPASGRLTGRERISYRNNSPDVLHELWLHVEQNICAKGSLADQLDQPPLVFLSTAFDFSCKGFEGGATISELLVGGKPAAYRIHGTTLRVELATPIDPGSGATIDVAWHFPVPDYGAGRMGRDGTLFELGQWYPRLAVYDDVKGWNHEPYIGAGEFYLEYGRFEVNLTVPAGFVVAGTGVLRNASQVLTKAQRARLELARTSDTAIAIITASEASVPAPAASAGTVTWRFTADSVRDVAFAAAPDFRWDASAWDGILIHTYYRPAATRWPEANRMAREAVKHFSEKWYRYPYPQMSSVEGPIEGMEYPMITFDPRGPSREELQWVVAHEIGHQWMPMIVGSNERLYPWMDEGFNTFIDLENAAKYFAGETYGDTIETQPHRLFPAHAIPGQEKPLITRPVEVQDLFWTGYQKPALMLSVLRDQVLGRERFEAAFRAYMRAWAFKHPTPADFFRLMQAHSGVDLAWFWHDWVYTTSHPDQVIEAITSGDSGSAVVIVNRGEMQLPIALRLTYADGGTEQLTLPVEAWNQGRRFTYRVKDGRRVVKAEVDPWGWRATLPAGPAR
jgi:hypothetical protein